MSQYKMDVNKLFAILCAALFLLDSCCNAGSSPLHPHNVRRLQAQQHHRSNSRLPTHILPVGDDQLQKRYGPFQLPQDDDDEVSLGSPAAAAAISTSAGREWQRQQHQGHPLALPETKQISQRKLLLPIISEGYASTNFQGGQKSKSKNEEEEKVEVDDVIEGEEISTSTTRTTTTTVKTTTTTVRTTRASTTTTARTTTEPPIIETLPSQNLPDKLPQSLINGYISSFAPGSDQRGETEDGDDDDVVSTRRPPPPPPKSSSSSSPALPLPVQLVPQPNRRVDDDGKNNKPTKLRTDPKTGEPLEFYTGELITADNNPGGEELVHFSFDQPQQQQKPQQSLVTPNDGVDFISAPSSSSSSSSPSSSSSIKFKQTVEPATRSKDEVYQAGYEQIDVPDNSFSNPDTIDPSQFHEDRPNIPGGQRQQAQDFYPLGKPTLEDNPPPPPPPHPNQQPHPRPRQPPHKQQQQKKPSQQQPPPSRNASPSSATPSPPSSSFIDFLIPSFLRSNPKSDRESPLPPPPPPPPPPPHPGRPTAATTPPPQPHPQLPKDFPTPPPNLQHLFPPPSEYGGALNPILLHVPDGFDGFPAPPGVEAAPQQQQQQAAPYLGPKRSRAKEEEGTRLESPARIGEGLATEVEVKAAASGNSGHGVATISVEPVQPEVRTGGVFPSGPNTNVPFPMQPINEPQQQQQQQQQQQHQSPSDPPLPEEADAPQSLLAYKDKLRDPEFHQNLTKAHIYYDDESLYAPEFADNHNSMDGNSIRLDESYLQDSNPFALKYPGDESATTTTNHEEAAAAVTTEATTSSGDGSSSSQGPQQVTKINALDFEEFGLMMTPPPLDQIAPPARPANPVSRTSKPDINLVYHPEAAAFAAGTTEESFKPMTDHTSSTSPSAEATTTIVSGEHDDTKRQSEHDRLISEQVTALLNEYFATPQRDKSKGAPTLYMTENSLIMEYGGGGDSNNNTVLEPTTLVPPTNASAAPEVSVEMKDEDPSTSVQDLALQEDLEVDLPEEFLNAAVRHPLIQKLIDSDELILPQGMLNDEAKNVLEARLEKLFVPSSSPDDSDWFLLDKHGRRVMKHRPQFNVDASAAKAKPVEEKPQQQQQRKDATGVDGGASTVKKIQRSDDDDELEQAKVEEGGFSPSLGPAGSEKQ